MVYCTVSHCTVLYRIVASCMHTCKDGYTGICTYDTRSMSWKPANIPCISSHNWGFVWRSGAQIQWTVAPRKRVVRTGTLKPRPLILQRFKYKCGMYVRSQNLLRLYLPIPLQPLHVRRRTFSISKSPVLVQSAHRCKERVAFKGFKIQDQNLSERLSDFLCCGDTSVLRHATERCAPGWIPQLP